MSKPEIIAKMEIVFQTDGQVLVSGPLDNKVICLGMLSMACQVVQQFKGQSPIEVPKLVIPKFPG